ncbi:MAG: hypothetical protein AMJ45_04490 [Syntrophobacter sp. DG_60]|nr:MAG: hypothetical protein AMJ45_04490 [Syntrophobacter sp. DG_60]
MSHILIKGARENNLKNIDVVIPKNKLTVITGISGSGKSSLAFDIIYKEGQRRYLMALAIPKQFLPKLDRPKAEDIDGLSPTLALGHKTFSKSPRSTVGTVTEVYDLLRILFARIGQPYCPNCQRPLSAKTVPEMVREIINLPSGTKVILMAPITTSSIKKTWLRLQKDGFTKVKIGSEIYDLTEDKPKEGSGKLDVIIDKLIIKEDIKRRLTDSIELALKLSYGINIEILGKENLFFSQKLICPVCDIKTPQFSPQSFSFNHPQGACPECKGLGERNGKLCPKCKGKRLKREALSVRINGLDIYELSSLPIEGLVSFISLLPKGPIAMPIISEVIRRLNVLEEAGLDYLSLSRPISTLSLGENQRLRLAIQLSSRLTGLIYILDEPTIGLHPKEIRRLISALYRLRDLGNTVIVIEHDPQTILSADYIIELGPGAGEEGGDLVFSGDSKDFLKSKGLTALYLTKKKPLSLPSKSRPLNNYLIIESVTTHNLKDITVKIPLNCITCITGVSGSGKSSLIIETLYRYLIKGKVDSVKGIFGAENIKKVILIDQDPIGKTPKANPATYSGAFNYIRNLFSGLPEARARGYRPDRFSFNVKGGRCEVCQGSGVIKVEMAFLPDVYVTCDACRGKRFNEDTLEIKFKGENIADILEMAIEQALEFFRHIPRLKNILQTLVEVGLGYLKLGQPATQLSSGEAQRLKLARELSHPSTGQTLYILDEPTTGLHLDEINKLIFILHKLVDKGNTVIVIENQLEIIRASDYIINLGPESGKRGGYLIACGVPDEF